MKTETREVIIEQKVYISDDGTEFDNEDSCLDYEFNKIKHTLTYYDAAMDETDYVDDCVFVDLRTQEEVMRFRHILDVCGNHDGGIDEPGLYMWWDTEGQWMNLDWLITYIRGGAEK